MWRRKFVLTTGLLLISFRAYAFPGMLLGDYLDTYGSPANPTTLSGVRPDGGKVLCYWENVSIDPKWTGLELRGNLIVLFEQKGDKLQSLQETVLGDLSQSEFKLLEEKFRDKWRLLASFPPDKNRRYLLDQFESKDHLYSAEISYSPDRQKEPAGPRLNFWVRFLPASRL